MIQEYNTPVPTPCFNGTHQASCSRADNHYVYLHEFWLRLVMIDEQAAILGLKWGETRFKSPLTVGV
jgi:hypothetical protein